MQDKVLEILQSALTCERILRFDQRRNFLHTVEQHNRDLKRLDPKYALQFDQAMQELRVFLDDSWENVNSAIERIIGVQREAWAKEIRPIKHSTLNGEKPSIELLSQALRLPSIATISSASHSILPAEAYAAFMASIDAAESAEWSWCVIDVEVELTPICVRYALPARVNDRLVALAFQHGDCEIFNAVAPMVEKPGRFWVAWRQEAEDASD